LGDGTIGRITFINNNESRFKLKKIILFLGLIFVGSIILSGAASAAYIHVNNTTGLKNAINNANTHNGDILNLTAGIYKEYNIKVTKNLTIMGPKTTTPTVIIDARNMGRVFNITKGVNVTLKYLIIQNGNATKDIAKTDGGGILNEGNLTINNCNIQKNTAEYGGGIYNQGKITITSSKIYQNNATIWSNDLWGFGGGINNHGILTLINSNLYNNIAECNGGGIENDGTCYVTGSNVNNNTAYDGGGGIDNYDGNMSLNESNINNNSASGNGGGIHNSSILTLSSSNVKNNIANGFGGGIYGWGGTLKHSNVYNNFADIGGGIYNYGTLNLNGSDIKNNNAGNNGGAIYNENLGAIDCEGILIGHFNRIVANNANQGSSIYNDGGSVNLEYNWWGSNSNPSSKVYGTGIDYNHWLVLKISAISSLIKNGGNSTITANLLYDSNGVYHNPTNGHVPDGIPIIFHTSLGTINTPVNLINGVAKATLKSGTVNGTADVTAKVDSQIVHKSVQIDTVAPKVSSTSPTNLKMGVSRTSTIVIKFSENIKNSTYYSNIKVKNLTTGKYVTITKAISGTYLNIKTSTKRTANTWYQLTIPKAGIKDYAGNNLLATYTFKFKTGT
jgi:hypothetical protein